MHGEEAAANTMGIEQARDNLPGILSDYELEDIWNLDETGLFYRTLPTRSLVTKSRKGGKLAKDRVTLNFIVNASGSECMIQMIGKSKKPRALKNIDTSSHFGIKYYNNSKSWMRTDIFQQVMNDFCRYTKYTLKRHHVVLLMDNFSGHKLPDYWK